MGLRYNPFTGSFDLTRSPGSYLDGEVAAYSDLPLDAAAAPLNSAWLVRAGSGLWLLTRKPAGIYIRTATGGTDRDADYTYAGVFPDVFNDANFLLYDNGDSTKNLQFQLSGIDTATTRTLTVPNASGTLPLLETANTYTQNQVFNGTNNTAPNQTAASGSSVMTRDLTDDAIFRRWNRWAIYENFNFKTAELTTIGGTASPSITTGAADIPAWSYRPTNVVDAANNYQALLGPYLQLSPVTARSIKNWSKRSVLALRIKHIASGGTTRYYWGPQASNWAGGALAVRGIGFEIVNNSLVATCHNGTSKTTASSGVTLSNLILYNLLIESDGAGGVRWYVDGTEQTALTGGPTGNSAGNSQFGFCTEAVNPTPAAGTFVAIQNLMLASAL